MQVGKTQFDIMRHLASGYVPRNEETARTNSPGPITLMYGNQEPQPLLFIDPKYIGEYYRKINGFQEPSLLQKVEFEQARMLSSGPFMSRNLGCGDSSPALVFDPLSFAMLKNRTIEIREVVTSKMSDDVRTKAQLIVAAMAKLGKAKPIKFSIHSPGGCATSMTSILDTMEMLKNTEIGGEKIIVETYLDGIGASAASVIFANGTPGHRFINPNAQLMIHQPSGGASGQTTDMEIENTQLQGLKEGLVQFYKRTTKADEEWIRRVIERDCYMKASEVIERGFGDKEFNSFNVEDLKELDLDLNQLMGMKKQASAGSCECS